MRVLFLASVVSGGGAERQLMQLASGLSERGHTVRVLAFRGNGDVDHGVDVAVLGKRGRWDLAGFAGNLVRSISDFAPDVLHGFLPLPNIVASWLAPLVGRPKVVWGVRAARLDLSRYEWGSRVAFSLSRISSIGADLIIANSVAGAQYHVSIGYPADRVVVVPNGIDTDVFRPFPEAREALRSTWGVAPDEMLVGLVGRVDPAKDHATFLRAVARARETFSNLRAVCIGGGTVAQRQALNETSRAMGLSGIVRWVDTVTDMRAAYSAIDLLCLSSVTEGFPNVVGEAMACGVPCVVTDAGDARMIVSDLGIVVPIGDADALAAGFIASFQRWSHTCRSLLRKRIVSDFPMHRMVEQTEMYLLHLTRQ